MGSKVASVVLALLFSTWAFAQPIVLTQAETGPIDDAPRGAPYHVVPPTTVSDPTLVPLRDYLSSRIDQLRSELLDQIQQQQKILDERNVQYAQRFDAQQEALSAALLAQKEAVANALSAAKEAVTKAEDASNKRFDSVNEFRNQLNDQAQTFMSKETAEARFAAVEEKTASNTDRLNGIQAASAGSSSTWALIGGAVLLVIAVATFGITAQRFRREPA